MSSSTRRVRVLVVDDSTFVRRTLRKMFEAQKDLAVVGEAGDGAEALEKIATLGPDVVTLDIQMPGMDGFTALRAIRTRWPKLPVIVLASASQNGAGAAFEALSLGAFEFIDKSRATSMDFHLLSVEILEKVRAAVQGQAPVVPGSETVRRRGRALPGDVRMICVGASTGGPQAIQVLLDALPASFPFPVAIVQHMPVGFTAAFAERLNHSSRVTVREARDEEVFLPGQALLAPAGRHLTFSQGRKGPAVALKSQPADVAHIPSVDVLLSSAAEVFGAEAIGIVLTGMGADGREGARRLAASGGFVVAESQVSCAVYGMPKAIVDAGLAHACWPLPEIAEQLALLASMRVPLKGAAA
jgi:two-component system chemotaxis response regulator CheB